MASSGEEKEATGGGVGGGGGGCDAPAGLPPAAEDGCFSSALPRADDACCSSDAWRDSVEAPAPAPVAARKPVNLIIMYNLKAGVTPADFETWVKTSDQPAMRGLARVADFQTLRAEKLLMGDGKPSVQYIETFSIPDLDGFVAEDMPGATVQGVMGQFMGFADAPQFIVVSEVQ
jgi:hypothetical protein